jgi:putative membrane protein
MSTRRLMAAAGLLGVALAAAPMSALHSQTPAQDSAAHRAWGVNPGPTAVGSKGSDILADSAFIREALAGNLLETGLGNLALQKGVNPAVKQFGQQMITDHTAMQKQWNALVSTNRLPITAVLNPTQQQQASQLGTLSGAEFDRQYMATMVQDHQNDVAAFQSQGLSARSAGVRQLASSGLATIQQHLSTATQVASQVGATTNVATTTPQYPQTPAPNGQVTTQPAPAPAPGQVPNPNDQAARRQGNGNRDVKADGELVREVTADHLMEIRLGEMAREKATNADVKRFANQAVANFTRWQNQWTGMASRNGMAFQPGMGPMHRQKLERLQKASGAQFDRVYLSLVTENLQSLLPYFRKEGRAARSPQVRNLVDQELPAVQQLLTLAQGLSGQVRADANVHGQARKVSAKQ